MGTVADRARLGRLQKVAALVPLAWALCGAAATGAPPPRFLPDDPVARDNDRLPVPKPAAVLRKGLRWRDGRRD